MCAVCLGEVRLVAHFIWLLRLFQLVCRCFVFAAFRRLALQGESMGPVISSCHGQSSYATAVINNEELLRKLHKSGVSLEVTMGGGRSFHSVDTVAHARVGCPTLYGSAQDDLRTLRRLTVTAEGQRLYTVLALDCDAPSVLGDVVHGLWCDLPPATASHGKDGAASACQEVVQFAPPCPLVGLHRYGLFVLEQRQGDRLGDTLRAERPASSAYEGLVQNLGFNARAFVDRHGLELRAMAFFEAAPVALSDPDEVPVGSPFNLWSPLGPFPEFPEAAKGVARARHARRARKPAAAAK